MQDERAKLCFISQLIKRALKSFEPRKWEFPMTTCLHSLLNHLVAFVSVLQGFYKSLYWVFFSKSFP